MAGAVEPEVSPLDAVLPGSSGAVSGAVLAVGIPPTGVKISLKTGRPELPLTNGTCSLAAVITPSNANTSTAITWSSSQPGIAAVDQKGMVTSKGVGNATITAKTANGKTATFSITVKPDLVAFDFKTGNTDVIYGFSNGTAPVYGMNQRTVRLALHPTFVSPANAYTGDISYSTTASNIDVVRNIDGTYAIRAKTAGLATIVAKAPNASGGADITASYLIYVIPPISGASIHDGSGNALGPGTSLYMNQGSTLDFIIKLQPPAYTIPNVTPAAIVLPSGSVDFRTTFPDRVGAQLTSIQADGSQKWRLTALQNGPAGFSTIVDNSWVSATVSLTVTSPPPVVGNPGMTYGSAKYSARDKATLTMGIVPASGATYYVITEHNNLTDAQNGVNPKAGRSWQVLPSQTSVSMPNWDTGLRYISITAFSGPTSNYSATNPFNGTKGGHYGDSVAVLYHVRNVGGFNGAGDGYIQATALLGSLYSVVTGELIWATVGMTDPYKLTFTWEKVGGASGYDSWCYLNNQSYGDDLNRPQPSGDRVVSVSGAMVSGTIRIVVVPYVMEFGSKVYGEARTVTFYINTAKFPIDKTVKFWDTTSTVSQPSLEFKMN
ncbi:MAG: Ig-like domain-containing protein [Micrococcales bacterium]|nr:Ig-like domain-containing protein [Micrococcales bacterium]